jgi:hypothetical protein
MRQPVRLSVVSALVGGRGIRRSVEGRGRRSPNCSGRATGLQPSAGQSRGMGSLWDEELYRDVMAE